MAEQDVFRVYEAVGKDGYPPEWHRLPSEHGTWPGVKDIVREQAGHRCVRCLHPYRKGEHPMERVEREVDGEILVSFQSWTPCDERCIHAGPLRGLEKGQVVQALARILTVHHLDGIKTNLRWWNLVALCQRCHLTIQGRVVMARVWPWEHSEWFRPYVGGYYASVYLGEELTREQVDARLDELLALERAA